MDLDEHLDADVIGQRMQLDQFDGAERRCDEQHTIGAHQAGVAHIVSADREVFAQHRQRHCCACGLQVGNRAGEELFVSEHRQRCCTTSGIGLGKQRRIEIDVERTLRRRASFDLADHGEFSARHRGAQRPRETAHRSALRCLFDQRLNGALIERGNFAMTNQYSIEIRSHVRADVSGCC